MRRTITIIILSFFAILTTNAQTLHIPKNANTRTTRQKGVRDDIPVKGKPQKSKAATPNHQPSSSRMGSHPAPPKAGSATKPDAVNKGNQKTTTPDTVYSHMTKKQHGWFEPLGILTKEQALHRDYSYRFTNRNAQGHWCKMEIIDGYGHHTTTGNFNPYILKLNALQTDTLANQEWAEKVKASCIYESIPDPMGTKVIQERAYDADMNVLYIFSQTPIGKAPNGRQQYVGSYKDIHGLPAEMRKDTTGTYTYGTLVMLTEDQWGNDSIIQYMDAKGRKKLNSDGVPMEIYVYDKEGHYLKQISCDEDGKPMIDNWGNCGLEVTWNKDHTIASIMYMDANWKPMPMPDLRETFYRKGVTKIIFQYDEYKRITKEIFVNSKDEPDVNNLGVHKTTYSYDDKGNLTCMRSLNKEGHLTPSDDSQTAITKFTYTKDGKHENFTIFDKDEQPCSTPGFFSRIHYEYDDQGKQILVEKYEMQNGKEYLVVKEYYGDTYKYDLNYDGSYRVDSMDHKGRIVYTGWFDKDGKRQTYEGKAYERTVYMDEGDKTTYIQTEYDEEGKPAKDGNGISRYKCVVDSVNLTKENCRYDLDNNLVECYIHQFDKGFNNIVAQYDVNAFGTKARCGGSSDVSYYKADVLYKPKGGFASFIGKDEFDEPEYIVTPTIIYYYKRMTKGDDVAYDENNHVISDFDELKDKLPKAMSIEVVDSTAYRLGIRDNDIILLYGNYYNDLEQTSSYNDFRSDWTIHNVLDGGKTNRMVVFRIEDAKNNQYGLMEIDGLKGTPSELGFITHIRFLTEKQKSRILQAIDDNMSSSHPLISSADRSKVDLQGDNLIVIAYNDMFRSERNTPYARQITDHAILLGACAKDWEMSWSMQKGSTDDLDLISYTRKKGLPVLPVTDFFFAKDKERMVTLTTNEFNSGFHYYTKTVSDEYFNKLLNLSKETEKLMEKKMTGPSLFSTKDLCGRWQIDNEVLGDTLPIGYLQLAKDGTCKGTITQKGYLTFSEALVAFTVDRDYDGRWTHQGNLIIFTPDKLDNETFTCTDILVGIDPSQEERGISMMNELCKNNKSYIKNRIAFLQNLDEILVIKSLDKKSLVLEEKDGDGIRLVKTKSTKAQ